MKRIRITALTLTALTLAACTQADVPVSSASTPTTPTGATAVTTAETAITTTEVSGGEEMVSDVEETTETESPPTPEHDFSALELIGYHMNENGDIIIGTNWEKQENLEPLREYFFGTWERINRLGEIEQLIIDDSEKCNLDIWKWVVGAFYRYNDTLIIVCSNSTTCMVYWLDINNPNVLYNDEFAAMSIDKFKLPYYFYEDRIYETAILEKTNMLINEPENNYLSRFRLFEIACDKGIDTDMIFIIDGMIDVNGKLLDFSIRHFDAFPIYRISETSDKIVLKTKLVNGLGDAFIDAVYTIEKVNSEWVRTVEFDLESFKERQ